MANLLAKIDLLKLKNAYISSDRNNGEVIVIPIQKNNIFVNKEKGTAWLSLTAWHNPQEFCTHTLFAGKKSEGGQLVGNLQTWEQANPNQRNQQQPNRQQQYQPTPQPRQDFSNKFDRNDDPDLPF
jgi:hypothetical protein